MHSYCQPETYDRHVDGHDYMWAVSEMIDSAKEFIFILVTYMLFLRIIYLLKLDLTSGLVAYSRTLPPSTCCILSWMASRSSSSKKGPRRCKDPCHCVQRGSSSFVSTGLTFEHEISLGYADQFYELETYQGDLIGSVSQCPCCWLEFQSKLDHLHPNIRCMRHPDHIGAKGTFLRTKAFTSKSLTFVLQIVLNCGLITRRLAQNPSPKLLIIDFI